MEDRMLAWKNSVADENIGFGTDGVSRYGDLPQREHRIGKGQF